MGETLEAIRDLALFAELWGIGGNLSRLREEYWATTSRLIAGVETVEEELKLLRAATDRQTRVLEGSLSNIDARVDFQTHVLRKVLDTLYQPSEVRARELRERGELALLAGLYDDALQDFRESLSENRYDFTCRYSLAAIEFEHLDDHEAAFASCERVLQYAAMSRPSFADPSPTYYSSRALLLMGQMVEDGGLMSDALGFYRAACEMSPDYPECFRRSASAATALGRVDLAIPALRAALLIDPSEAVTIERDPSLAPIRDGVRELLDETRREYDQAASALDPLATQAVEAYKQVSSKVQQAEMSPAWDDLEPGVAEELGDLVSRSPRLERALARASERRARGGLLDLADACRHVFLIVDETFQVLIPRLGRFAEWLSDSVDTRTAQELDQTQAWAEAQHRQADELTRGPNMWFEGWGCLLILWGLVAFPIGGLLVLGAIATTVAYANGDDQVPLWAPIFLLALGVPVLLSWVIPGVLLDSKKTQEKRARQEHARNVVAASQDARDRAAVAIGAVRTAAANLSQLEQPLRQAASALDRDEIRCSVVILDAGRPEEAKDEVTLAKALQDIAQDRSELGRIPLEQAKEIIRGAPAIFLENLTIPNAESIAAYLNREFELSVGIKRSYTEPMPQR